MQKNAISGHTIMVMKKEKTEFLLMVLQYHITLSEHIDLTPSSDGSKAGTQNSQKRKLW